MFCHNNAYSAVDENLNLLSETTTNSSEHIEINQNRGVHNT